MTEPKPRRPDDTDFKALYRKLERALIEIEQTDDIAGTLGRILEALVGGFRDELGIEGGRIYKKQDDSYFLCCGFGSSIDAPVGLRVPSDYPPHLQTLEEGLLIMRADHPDFDAAFERVIGVESTFAAIAVGRDRRFVIAFSIDGDVREERLLYSLTAIRHVINLKLEQQQFTGMLREARAIQESMLPLAPPELRGFELAGRTRPAESVSGDLYDYLPDEEGAVAVAIADASGHGVPAALMARDVITGLRTLAADRLPPSRVVARLNRVIHKATLASKFVSLFYTRLVGDGTIVYCNAGHNPPLLARAGSIAELRRGGPVLGPIPGARYDQGEEALAPGDRLVMFTDGIVERANAAGEMFGGDRLREVVGSDRGRGAEDLLDRIFAATDAHAAGRPHDDDMTAVVLIRE